MTAGGYLSEMLIYLLYNVLITLNQKYGPLLAGKSPYLGYT
jgi:hypothetical protein